MVTLGADEPSQQLLLSLGARQQYVPESHCWMFHAFIAVRPPKLLDTLDTVSVERNVENSDATYHQDTLLDIQQPFQSRPYIQPAISCLLTARLLTCIDRYPGRVRHQKVDWWRNNHCVLQSGCMAQRFRRVCCHQARSIVDWQRGRQRSRRLKGRRRVKTY
jgi:hypothetical protein